MLSSLSLSSFLLFSSFSLYVCGDVGKSTLFCRLMLWFRRLWHFRLGCSRLSCSEFCCANLRFLWLRRGSGSGGSSWFREACLILFFVEESNDAALAMMKAGFLWFCEACCTLFPVEVSKDAALATTEAGDETLIRRGEISTSICG